MRRVSRRSSNMSSEALRAVVDAEAATGSDGQGLRSPVTLGRRVRAFRPQPGCHFEFEGGPLKVWRAQTRSGIGGEPGSSRLDGQRFTVACGDGAALDLLELQRPGGRRQPVAAFLAARRH